MKIFKAICATVVLALSLSIPTYAETGPGDGHAPGKTAPTDLGIRTITSNDAESAGATETFSHDGSLVSIADILWALTAMY